MKISPITPHMGAEVSGLNLAALSDNQVETIKEAFLQYQVLAFRDQDISREQHKAFGRLFGELHIHPSKKHLDTRSDPEIFSIRTRPDSPWTNGEAWHTDVSCDPVPPLGSMLYVRELPGESGGDTLFANMYLAFATLAEPLQNWLRTLSALHDGRKDLASYNIKLKPGQDYPSAVHPVVTRHPDTGREILFVNRSFTEKIVDLSKPESDALLELLWQHVENNPRLQCRVRWLPGSIVFWDNRCTWHHAVWDYYPNSRTAERVTIQAAAAPAR